MPRKKLTPAAVVAIVLATGPLSGVAPWLPLQRQQPQLPPPRRKRDQAT